MRLLALFMGIILARGWRLSLAENIYIAQTAQEANTGADAANAHAVSWFNAAGNWGAGAGKIGAGDTVHLCGTITGAVGATILTFQGSGTSGNPITLKWEPGASLSSPAGSGVNAGNNNYLVIDGNGTAGSIINTANGSSRSHQLDVAGISAPHCDGCEIKGLTVKDIFVHDQFTDHTNGNGVGIHASGNDLSIHDNTVAQAYIGIELYHPTKSIDHVQVYHNEISATNWGIDVPSNNDNSVSHVYIHENHIHDVANWDSDNDAFHRDGIFLRHSPDGGGAGYVTDVFIYNNLFDGAFSDCCGTAWIFWNSHQNRICIFNNILIHGGSSFLLEGGLSGDRNFYVFNNVLDSKSGGNLNFGWVSGLWMENNIFLDLSNWANYFHDFGSDITFDYNAYNNSNTSNAYTNEPHWVVTAGLNLDSSYRPNAGSPVIGKGINLTSLGIPELNLDRAGNPRPSTGAWDIGAYQYVGESIRFSNADRRMPITPPPAMPNPVTVESLKQLLRNKNGMVIHDLAGKPLAPNAIGAGIYLACRAGNTAPQKVIVIK